jgi:glucosamine kinase
MILIADSGSTKCDWVLKNAEGASWEFQTIGYNPLFHPEERILNALLEKREIQEFKDQIERIYYFGAGTSTPMASEAMANTLKKVFTEAQTVKTMTDMYGAALAAYNGSKGIACILGTGANACVYDGKIINTQKPALGYILGDEASGAYFGKQLISAFLYEVLPPEIQNDFEVQFNLKKADIIQAVYQQERPNVFLASFMPFIHKHRSHPFFQLMLSRAFRKFLLVQVTCFKGFREVPVHFVGSVAWFFQEEIKREVERLNIISGQFISKPINQLKLLNLQILIN